MVEGLADAEAADSTDVADGGEIEELVELQLIEEARLEKLFEEKRRERGLDDDETLEVFFKLFDMWIQLYRLNKCYEALLDVVPVCRRRGERLHVQGVQALAFTRWKQSAFREAADLFHEIEGLIGSSAALCENIGHTYSSLGDYPQASTYFSRALLCMDREEQLGAKEGNRGGVMLGLGLIEERQGNLENALESVREAQRLFRLKANGKPASLVAKAGMSIAKILLKLSLAEKDPEKQMAMEEEAIEREQENVALFEVTCGADSPLTASALRGLGSALMRRQRLPEAQQSFAQAYLLEAQKDAFDLLSIMEVHNLLVNAHMESIKLGGPLDRKAFASYEVQIDVTLKRVRAMKQDGNAGAYYKVAGELRAFGENYAGATQLLSEAIDLFKGETPDKAETVEGLIQHCEELRSFCEKQLAAASVACAVADGK